MANTFMFEMFSIITKYTLDVHGINLWYMIRQTQFPIYHSFGCTHLIVSLIVKQHILNSYSYKGKDNRGLRGLCLPIFFRCLLVDKVLNLLYFNSYGLAVYLSLFYIGSGSLQGGFRLGPDQISSINRSQLGNLVFLIVQKDICMENCLRQNYILTMLLIQICWCLAFSLLADLHFKGLNTILSNIALFVFMFLPAFWFMCLIVWDVAFSLLFELLVLLLLLLLI